MTEKDRDYLRRRAESLSRAEGARDPAVAHIHRELAARYAKLIEHADGAKRA